MEESKGIRSDGLAEPEWKGEGDEIISQPMENEEVMGEGDEELGMGRPTVSPDPGDIPSPSGDCTCEPCLCEESEPEEDDTSNATVMGSGDDEPEPGKTEEGECACELPCECSPSETLIELMPKRDLSCPNCCKNNVKCRCVPPPGQGEEEEVEEDPMLSFVRKLEAAMVSNQRRTCRSIFPRSHPAKPLTEGTVLDLLVKDTNGRPAIYLPGNQLYPKILSERLKDSDMGVIGNIMSHITGVTTISIPYNSVGNGGLEILASVVQTNPSVEHLNLMNNDITGAGLLPFCEKMMMREPLLSLRLSGNKFGAEGYEALSCLVLSGHIPLDLDLSETDMDVVGFQAFCAALIALDHGEDYPQHYVTREKDLPMDLETLKHHKIMYNKNIHKLNALSTTEKIGTAEFYNLNIPDDFFPLSGRPEKVPQIPQFLTPEIAGKFSATVLETLFELSERKALVPPNPDPAQLLTDYPTDKVTETLCQAMGQGDLDDFIASVYAERNKPKVKKNYREIPITSPDLYRIDHAKGAAYHGLLHEIDDPETLRKMEGLVESSVPYHFHGQMVDPADSILERGKYLTDSPVSGTTLLKPLSARTGIDDQLAENAARKYLKTAFTEASQMVGASAVDDQTNVVQLVLMTIVEIVHSGQQKRLAAGGSGALSERDCHQITEDAIDRVMALLESRVPVGCGLSQETVRLFIESLFQTAEGTFFNLLENPHIMEALHDAGTLACHVQTLQAKKHELEDEVAASPDKIQYLVTKFLDGVLEEAGRMIGTGDPLNYRSLPTVDYLKKRGDYDEFEMCPAKSDDPISALVRDLFDMGTSVGLQTMVEAEEAQKAQRDSTFAAEIMVDNLFEAAQDFVTSRPEHTQHLILEEEETGGVIRDRKYPYVSRPTRLVLGRPLFHVGQVEMAAMMFGDFMRENSSVKDLHLHKWQLHESGLTALMDDRLMENRHLVLLDLSNNELGPEGAKLLASYIRVNPNLKHLILNQNRLRDPGISYLARTIAKSHLESLNVACNDATEVGLDLLLAEIPLTQVSALYLWGNGFGLKTWRFHKKLLESGKLTHTDTLLQDVEGTRFTVKNNQVRDTNFWYEVPFDSGSDLVVPPYLKKGPSKLTTARPGI